MPPQCAVKCYRSPGIEVIVGVLLLSSATVSSPRRFSFRRSSLLAWRSSFFISRRSLRERSVGAIDEFGVGDADELGEGDANRSTVGRDRSARGIGVALGLGDADSTAVELGLSLERDLPTGDRAEVGLAAADGAGLAVALDDADGDDVDLAFGLGINVGRGVAVTVSTGVAVTRPVADGVVVAVAVVSGVARRTGVAVAPIAKLAGVEIEVALADGTAVAAVAGEDADVVDVSAAAFVGFTNVFGGAFGGGVASAFIFARTFSVACGSPVFSQPRSTTTLTIVSLSLRGRSTAWPRVIKGAGMTMA
jgi:hypothetical protein